MLWQDPYELYTTVLVGIDPVEGCFVGADPVLHSPTRFFISIELKDEHVELIRRHGWAAWERASRSVRGIAQPVEVLVGGLPGAFLRYVRMERAAKGLDAGYRQLLAEKLASLSVHEGLAMVHSRTPKLPPDNLHGLAKKLQLSETEILDLIQSAPRLKMAVRGWVAEEHLVRTLQTYPETSTCRRLRAEGGPDVLVALRGGADIAIECKNILRSKTSVGEYRLDFQRTRASNGLVSSSAPASRAKSANRSKDTAAELLLRRRLWRLGLRYRLHRRELHGCPDLVFPPARVAVFIDGDFWHGRDWELREARLAKGGNASYWTAKIAYNRERDAENAALLEDEGWTVLRVWEGDVKRSPQEVAAQVAAIVLGARGDRQRGSRRR